MIIGVVDYGMGNMHSVAKAFQFAADEAGLNAQVRLCRDANAVDGADRVVFPGQGAMPDCMAALREKGLDGAVLRALRSKPFFGVCVGAQLLLEGSDEGGDVRALGFFKGRSRRFKANRRGPDGSKLKIPHMGWNEVRIEKPHPVFEGIESGTMFYFVHSYKLEPQDPELVLAVSDYPDPFCAVLGRGNVVGAQFHPEKSHAAGLRMIGNFLRWKV